MLKVKKPVVPKEFKKYFWDVDFSRLNLREDFKLILSRILSLGNFKAVKWLMQNVDKKQIREYVDLFGDRQLDKRSNNLWKMYFRLPTEHRP